MQKSTTPAAYILVSLLFVFIAVASFATFAETEEICTQATNCLKPIPATNGEMIWEVISRQFLTLLPI